VEVGGAVAGCGGYYSAGGTWATRDVFKTQAEVGRHGESEEKKCGWTGGEGVVKKRKVMETREK